MTNVGVDQTLALLLPCYGKGVWFLSSLTVLDDVPSERTIEFPPVMDLHPTADVLTLVFSATEDFYLRTSTFLLRKSTSVPTSEDGSVTIVVSPTSTVTPQPTRSSNETDDTGARGFPFAGGGAEGSSGLSIGQKAGIGLGIGLCIIGVLIIAVVVLKLKRWKCKQVARMSELITPEVICAELPATEGRYELDGRAADPRALRSELEGESTKVIYGGDPVLKLRIAGSVECNEGEEAAESLNPKSKLRGVGGDGGKEADKKIKELTGSGKP